MTARKKPSAAKKPATTSVLAVAPATATHVANHVHVGPACTPDSLNPACANHPGPMIHCFEVHIPFIGGTMCSCVHAVL